MNILLGVLYYIGSVLFWLAAFGGVLEGNWVMVGISGSIGWFMWHMGRKRMAARKGIEIETSYTVRSTSDNKKKLKPIKNTSEGWLLDPGATFPIHLDIDKDIAEQVRKLIDWDEQEEDENEDLTILVAKHNIKCPEVLDFSDTYKPVYLSELENIKSQSDEWQEADEYDKDDLIAEFREQAEKALPISVPFTLWPLFECEPSDIEIDDALIEKYGGDVYVYYLEQYKYLGKVRKAKASTPMRRNYTKLKKAGLALQGDGIPADILLNKLTLEKLNKLSEKNGLETFSRKKDAISALSSIEGVGKQCGEYMSIRELFMLTEMPEIKSGNIEVKLLSDAMDYAEVVARLIERTYRASKAVASRMSYIDAEYMSGWEVECHGNCKKGKSLEKKYPLKKPPQIPAHMGCNCFLESVYKDD